MSLLQLTYKPYVGQRRINGRTVHQTRSGLQIGLLYMPPPPAIGSEAERVQGLLLDKRRPLAVDQAAVILGATE